MMQNKRLWTIVICLFILALLSGVPVSAAEKVAVAVNQSRILTFTGVSQVAVANPDIADVSVVSGSEIILIGKAPGMTTLHIWSLTGRQSFLVEVGTDDTNIANAIRETLGYKDIRVSKINNNIILEGTVNDQYQKNRAEKVAGAYGEKVINLLELIRPTQVKIEAKIIEINREKAREIGIKWGNDPASPGTFRFGQTPMTDTVTMSTPTGLDNNGVMQFKDVTSRVWNNALSIGGTGTKLWGQTLGGLGGYWDINAQLNAMIKNGMAKILSQPNIVAISGEKADIMVGGQIPIPVGLDNGRISIEWKDYGIKLEINPEVNAQGLIYSKFKAEVSALDWNSTHRIELGQGMKIPPLTVRKSESTIALVSGQTMAIGGLIASTTAQDVYKVPLLGDLPILGKLFQSKSFTKGETELIILITPTIVDPKEYVPDMSQELQEFKNENPWGGMQNVGKDQGANRGR